MSKSLTPILEEKISSLKPDAYISIYINKAMDPEKKGYLVKGSFQRTKEDSIVLRQKDVEIEVLKNLLSDNSIYTYFKNQKYNAFEIPTYLFGTKFNDLDKAERTKLLMGKETSVLPNLTESSFEGGSLIKKQYPEGGRVVVSYNKKTKKLDFRLIPKGYNLTIGEKIGDLNRDTILEKINENKNIGLVDLGEKGNLFAYLDEDLNKVRFLSEKQFSYIHIPEKFGGVILSPKQMSTLKEGGSVFLQELNKGKGSYIAVDAQQKQVSILFKQGNYLPESLKKENAKSETKDSSKKKEVVDEKKKSSGIKL